MKRTRLLIVTLVLVASFNPTAALALSPRDDCKGWVWGPLNDWRCVVGALDCDC